MQKDAYCKEDTTKDNPKAHGHEIEASEGPHQKSVL